MKFAGARDFPQPPDYVWPRISDARFLVDSLKKVESVALREPDRAEWKLRPALSFVAGTLDTRLEILERDPPARMRVTLTSKGIGASSTVEVLLILTAAAAGTHIEWQAEIQEMSGLLKMVPKGLIEAAAKKAIEDVWTGVAERMAAENQTSD